MIDLRSRRICDYWVSPLQCCTDWGMYLEDDLCWAMHWSLLSTAACHCALSFLMLSFQPSRIALCSATRLASWDLAAVRLSSSAHCRAVVSEVRCSIRRAMEPISISFPSWECWVLRHSANNRRVSSLIRRLICACWYWAAQNNKTVNYYGLSLGCWSPNDPKGEGYREAHRCTRNALEWVKAQSYKWITSDMKQLERRLNNETISQITPPHSQVDRSYTRKRPLARLVGSSSRRRKSTLSECWDCSLVTALPYPIAQWIWMSSHFTKLPVHFVNLVMALSAPFI